VALAVRAQVKDAPGIGAPTTSAESSQPGARDLAGPVCPHCRRREPVAADATATPTRLIPRCSHDGYALIPAECLAEADGDPFLGVTVADRFVITGRVGAGSMGTVYRARQEAVGRDVAVKILRADRAFDAQAKARFSREARAMSLLTSPHTVTVFDFGEVPDPHGDELAEGSASLYLAMEMLEGESLGARLKRTPRIEVTEAVRIAREALLSLEEAHEKGIIHRDLKPDNLFLTRGPGGDKAEVCKVLDFGIAKIQSEQPSVDALETQAGTVFGTPRYMSPEQAQGRSLDARSDLYSLGVLLYQMLVGRPPFIDEDAVVVMARHIKTVPTPPTIAAPDAGIGEALSRLVMSTLAKNPDARPESATQLIADLDEALADRQATALVPSPESPAPPVASETAAPRRGDSHPEAARDRDRRLSLVRLRSARSGWLIAGAAAIVGASSFAVLGSLGGARGAPLARAELTHLVALRLQTARAQALAEVAAASPAPPASSPSSLSPSAPASASSPAASASSRSPTAAPKKGGAPRRKYSRFE
jgi:eukaryotic-like serine/threonine-protein kinase